VLRMMHLLLATLLVLNKADATLAFVDPSTLKVMSTIPTGEGPHEVEVTADGKTALVANYGVGPRPGNTLSVIDVASRKERRRMQLPGLWRPHGMYTVGSNIYFTIEGSRAVARYDGANDRIDWISGTGQDVTHMLVVSRDEKKVYTANIGSDSVTVIDLNRAPVAFPIKQIAVGKGPEAIDISPDGKEVWVASRADGPMSVIDTATDKVVANIAIGTKMANRLKFTRDGKRVLVSDPPNAVVLVYDVATRELVQKVTTNKLPLGILMAPDGKRAYIACAEDNVIQVLDLGTLAITGSIGPFNVPDGMTWVP
jgi:YVTN family beta-propeller protein